MNKQKRNACKALGEETNVKEPFEKPRCIWVKGEAFAIVN
jgi:hypothetical protein